MEHCITNRNNAIIGYIRDNGGDTIKAYDRYNSTLATYSRSANVTVDKYNRRIGYGDCLMEAF